MGKINVKTYSDPAYELPAGILDENGKVHKDYDLVRMTGVEEEAISANDVKSNMGKVIQVLVSSCCVRIGDLLKEDYKERDWDKLISKLYIGDIDHILMHLRKLSHGDDPITMHQTCPSCKEKFMYEQTSDEWEIKPFKGNRVLSITLEDGYIHSERGKEDTLILDMEMRLATNADRIILDAVSRSNLGLAFTKMIVRCTEKFGDIPGQQVTENMIRSLSSKDRKIISDTVSENAFGVDPEIQIICPLCGYAYKASMNATNFF